MYIGHKTRETLATWILLPRYSRTANLRDSFIFFEKALFGRLLKMILMEILYYNQWGESLFHIHSHSAHEKAGWMGFGKSQELTYILNCQEGCHCQKLILLLKKKKTNISSTHLPERVRRCLGVRKRRDGRQRERGRGYLRRRSGTCFSPCRISGPGWGVGDRCSLLATLYPSMPGMFRPGPPLPGWLPSFPDIPSHLVL